MSKRIQQRMTLLALTAVTLFTGSCAVRSPRQVGMNVVSAIVINDEIVRPGPGSILQLLLDRFTGLRMGAYMSSAAEQPLVLVDGAAVLRVHALSDIPSSDVERVTILQPNEAVTVLGTRARQGAVIVTTRGGRAR